MTLPSQVVVIALVRAVPTVLNVFMVCLISWLIFAMIKVEHFNGKFAYPLDNVTKKRLSDAELATKWSSLAANYTWLNPLVNFDNVFNAYLALLQVVCLCSHNHFCHYPSIDREFSKAGNP